MNTLVTIVNKISLWGDGSELPESTRRKLRIFNLLNVLAMFTGLLIPAAGLLNNDHLPWEAWLGAFSPAIISSTVLFLTGRKKHSAARTLYFFFYPLFTFLVYFRHADFGLELFFILFGVLSVFFINRIRHVILTCSYCLIGYLASQFVAPTDFFRLVDVNPAFYLANQTLAGFFIFFALFLIKNETISFENQLRKQALKLYMSNVEVVKQSAEIKEKADRLEKQAMELAELNKLKNKLFSIVSHDLRNPIYALRNYFTMVQQYQLPAEDVKSALPDIINDLNYTTNLLENLLTWSKSQITTAELHPSEINIKEMTEQVLLLMRLQAENKKIKLENTISCNMQAFADPASVQLVLRNLLSNAIKFSPENSIIEIGAENKNEMVQVFVQDYGKGMEPEQIEKILIGEHLSTEGTSSEPGTGLGLLLCKEYLVKNKGALHIESKPGSGSRFSFLVPAQAKN